MLALLLGCLAAQTARAHGVLRDGAGAATGVFAGIYLHEAGHALSFRATGADEVRIRVPGGQCALLCGQTDGTWKTAPGPAAERINSAAGFLSSNLAMALLLRHGEAARSAVGQGFIATNLYSNVSHVVTYYTKVRGRNGYRGNDIDAYELAGGNPHVLSAALVGYSIYALHRMHRKRIPILFMQTGF
jgi:hypothetical protein